MVKKNIKPKVTKTLGPKGADFILGLYEQDRPIFTLEEASKIRGLKGKPLQKFLEQLIKKGIISRLISGLFAIVPFEMGFTKEFMGNPYVLTREIVRHKFKLKKPPYFISHASAMNLHQMMTQPQLVVYATVPKQIKQHFNIMGTEFRFVTCKEKDFFGHTKIWVDKSELVYVSNLEKTVIDGLNIPQYCGGITEVAKGLWMKRNNLDLDKLVDYAEKINKGAVYRRLGFLLEKYKIDCPRAIDRLQEKLTESYLLLDPTLLDEGKHQSRWRLRINIPENEFLSVVRT